VPTSRLTPLLCALLLATVALVGCGEDRASPPTKGTPATTETRETNGTLADVPELYRRLQPSVVTIVRDGGEGSGVVIRPRRIVTNHHVIEGTRTVTVVLASGERIPGRVLASDPRSDLAVLAVNRDLPPAELADDLPPVGSLAVAIGNPLGFEESVTAGVVSGVQRSIPSGGQTPALVDLIQTDAAISPGNSGGALVGADGKVIGINVAYIPPQARAVSIGFAIPAPTVSDVVTQLLRNGRVEHPYLGLQLRPLTAEVAQQLGLSTSEGAIILAVQPAGPGDEAGLRPGDLIVKAGDRPVRAVEDLLAVLREHRPGDRIALTVLRDGKRRQLDVRLGERPS
jgi:S1-C subfamily serine protease